LVRVVCQDRTRSPSVTVIAALVSASRAARSSKICLRNAPGLAITRHLQVRLYAEPHTRLAPGPAGSWDKIEDQARRYARYFDFAPLYGIVQEAGPVVPADGGGGRAFRHFRPSFVYRYVRVPGVTAEQVREIGLLYARSALEARRTEWQIAREHGWDTLRDAEYLAVTRLQADALGHGRPEPRGHSQVHHHGRRHRPPARSANTQPVRPGQP